MCQLYFFIAAKLSELGDAVPPDPLGFFALRLERQGHAGLARQPDLPLQASRRRSGCVPAEPYPPLESCEHISSFSCNNGADSKVRFCSHVRF